MPSSFVFPGTKLLSIASAEGLLRQRYREDCALLCGTQREQRGKSIKWKSRRLQERLVDERVFDSAESRARADPKSESVPKGTGGVVYETWS